MIHSLAGGTIKDGGVHTFILVNINNLNEEKWYLSDEWSVDVGDDVYVEFKGQMETAKVVRVEKALGQAGPVSIGRLTQIEGTVLQF